ncbi:MAG: CHAD domain-containing protein [Candidatus Omnitrophota bacterium]
MRNKIDPYRYSRKIIFLYLDSFLKERNDVLLSAGIEPVHRMRVASRRLRAALSTFKGILPVKKSRAWRKEIAQIGRALGLARQLDVQIKFLEAARKRLKKSSRVIHTEGIIRFLKRKREQAQGRIGIELKGFEIKTRLPGLKDCLRDISSGSRKSCADTFLARKKAMILKRLDTLLDLAPYVFKPKKTKELHRMRIAAKKLRYTLEIFRPSHKGKRFDGYIYASRDIQDSLGDLHELDLLIEVLSGFLKGPDKGLKATAAYLTRECAGLRKGVYGKFVSLWKNLRKTRLWEKLRRDA